MRNQLQQLPEPLNLLFVCAGPENTKCLRLGEEIREIEYWLNSGPFRDRFSIKTVFATRQSDLQHALLTHAPHILHFSGHGSASGIILENKSGNASVFTFEQLAELLTAIHDNLRMVVLNACNSGKGAEVILQAVDHVVGMNHKILDRSAIDFATALYLSIGFDRSLRECFLSARAAVKPDQITQTHIPVLLSKDGFDPARIYPLSWVALQSEEELRRQSVGDTVEDTTGIIQLEIFLLSPNTHKASRWRYVSDQEQEFFESIDEPRERLTPELMWKHLAAETNRLEKGLGNRRMTPPDIFLMLRDNLILNLYPERTLENIICQVCQAASGANVYIVCDREVPFNVLYQKRKYQTVINRWFQTLLTCGVTDVIEIPKSHKSKSASEPETLRKCANESQDRRQRLLKLVSAEDWVLELRPQAVSLKLFLEHFSEGDLGVVNGKNLAVFYDLKPNSGLSELLKNSRERNSTGKWFIAAHAGSKIDMSDLEELWKQESNEKAPELFDGIFEFHGMFEWLYALCRLHRAVQLARETSPNIAGKALF